VNKNTIIAFVLILGSIQFFTGRFYYEKVLHKPYPYGINSAVNKKLPALKKSSVSQSVVSPSSETSKIQSVVADSSVLQTTADEPSKNIRIENDDIFNSDVF